MAKRNYIIYSDESDRKGKYFSNFFGGVLLKAEDREEIDALLTAKKIELNLNGEIKWEKVTANYLEKYKEFISFYFTFVATSRLRIRLMFTQNIHVPKGLTREQVDEQYLRLYYQFYKHGFGIKYCNPNSLDRVYFHIFPDQLPESSAKIADFKSRVSNIPNANDMRGINVFIPKRHINDIDSSQHVILQGLDIILGSVCAQLNGKLYIKPEGARRRGKRTIAKEKLYRHINSEIQNITPRLFNIGANTGSPNGPTDRWDNPYRHWLFKPTDHEVDLRFAKGGNRVG
ncbi:DUF3800 domain-containing protein [Pelagovum pacificum]|uniref:DUF3800 domain-containing protein n=1 Tax=Pelagovum pacificum TaxID=2588711 RepID=A0A5C5GHL9_9RHOB|nr:hypothetical protein [Pelagovum pacificum]QQA43924.1 hypothetical protein I8N54_04925 [Pelagovum pacificum]TNY32946.1 hypothetical protein FHY64_06620 [Pelagovum pacificum]